jgi:hypothetical protein
LIGGPAAASAAGAAAARGAATQAGAVGKTIAVLEKLMAHARA